MVTMTGVGILLICTWNVLVGALDLYPWGESDVVERSEDILEGLRKDLRLHVLDDVFSPAFFPTDEVSLTVRNMEGVEFKVTTSTLRDASGNGDSTGAALFDVVKLSAALDGNCAVLPIDYWNYEWCHRSVESILHAY